MVSTDTQTFVWGSLTACWSCEEPMLVWDARSPGPGKRWTRVPSVDVKPEADLKRLENHPEVQRVVDAWIRAVRSDIAKASIRPKRTKASGRLYSAFVCPASDSAMGQYFISCILPEKWSILSGPDLESAPTPAPHPASAVKAAYQPRGFTPVSSASLPPQVCDWCGNDPHPEFECVWRRLRGGDCDKHYSDGVYASISNGSLTEEEGTAILLRMVDRTARR